MVANLPNSFRRTSIRVKHTYTVDIEIPFYLALESSTALKQAISDTLSPLKIILRFLPFWLQCLSKVRVLGQPPPLIKNIVII